MKRSRQKKSRMYYYFWSVMSATVLLGQLYVGTGYRLLHQSMEDLLDKVDGVILEVPNPTRPKYL